MALRRQQLCDARPALPPCWILIIRMPGDEHDLSLVSNTLRDAIADARTDTSLKCRLGAENRRSSQLGPRSHARQLVRRSYVSSRRKPAGSRPPERVITAPGRDGF
ncbi:hypothetical protein ACB371_12380 [Klebsiella pneumoniae]